MIKKIAIVKLSAMGDIIHAMIALQYIKKKYPDLIIDWFVEDSFSEILNNNPHVNNIIKLNLKSIKKNKIEIFKQVNNIIKYKSESYDLVIDAQGLIKSAVICLFLGKNKIGFSKKSIREKFASFFYSTKVDISYDENVIERNAKIFSYPLNFNITKDDILNKKPFLYFRNEDKIIYKYLSNTKKNILFVIGASWPSKIYPKEKFATIINSLEGNCLIVWGSEEEKSMADYISSISTVKILPKLNLNTLKALVSNVDLLIGNDTGPTHIAWALNIPSITIFGNTPGYRNTYLTKINKIVESTSIVNPFKLNKNDYSINEIKEEKILQIAKGLLNA